MSPKRWQWWLQQSHQQSQLQHCKQVNNLSQPTAIGKLNKTFWLYLSLLLTLYRECGYNLPDTCMTELESSRWLTIRACDQPHVTCVWNVCESVISVDRSCTECHQVRVIYEPSSTRNVTMSCCQGYEVSTGQDVTFVTSRQSRDVTALTLWGQSGDPISLEVRTCVTCSVTSHTGTHTHTDSHTDTHSHTHTDRFTHRHAFTHRVMCKSQWNGSSIE